MTISDEDLAKVAWTETRTDFIRAIRAMRAALPPPVTPLAPGETVTIPTTLRPSGGLQFGQSNLIHADLWFLSGHGERDYVRSLDAAGVQALIDVARRWQAAQEDDDE